METEGYWLRDRGHEFPEIQQPKEGALPACPTCNEPIKYIKRDQKSGQEKYESDKESGEAEKIAKEKGKARQVVEKLRVMRLAKAAEIVEAVILQRCSTFGKSKQREIPSYLKERHHKSRRSLIFTSWQKGHEVIDWLSRALSCDEILENVFDPR